MIFKKIKKLTKKIFSSKTYLLMVLNKFAPAEFGEIKDIMLDKEAKNIYLELEKNEQESVLNIINYSIKYEGSQAYLHFDKLELSGFLKSLLKDFTLKKKIKIDPKYIKIVRTLL